MPELHLIERDGLSFSDLARILERHRLDTLVDARPSDEPGDFSYPVLAALCSAFGYGYLRRGGNLGAQPTTDFERAALAASMGSLAQLARHGRVGLLTATDAPHLSLAAAAAGLTLVVADPSGAVRAYEDHLPLE